MQVVYRILGLHSESEEHLARLASDGVRNMLGALVQRVQNDLRGVLKLSHLCEEQNMTESRGRRRNFMEMH
jgi:hypothetical protein